MGLPRLLHDGREEREKSVPTNMMCITFIQCRTNVEDVGLALYKCCTNHVYWVHPVLIVRSRAT